MPKDNRRAKRRPVRHNAWLTLSDGTLSPCVLSDISETGACIVLANAAAAPDKFSLVLSANGAARRVCRVMWRGARQIGVRFDKKATAMAMWPETPSEAKPQRDRTARVILPT